MSYANGTIVSPVSVNDVQQAVGSSSPDVGTLCKSQNVRPWAKYKPIEYKPNNVVHLGLITDSQRASVNWGMDNIPIWTNKDLGKVVNCWIDGSTAGTNAPDCGIQQKYWTNKTPTSCFRLTDFVRGNSPTTQGYFVNANPPIAGVNSVIKRGSLVTVTFTMDLGGIYSGHTLWYSNFSVMNNVSYQSLYFGIVMKVGGQVFYATQDNTVGDLGVSVGTLWSIGAVVRFKVGSSSGALKDAIDNDTPISIFPVMMSAKNYVENTEITAATPAQVTGNFVAINEKEEIVVPGTITVVPEIIYFYAWKDNTSNPRKNLRICYNLYVITNDTTSHYINVTLTALDANGNQVGSANNELNAATPYEPGPTQSQIEQGYSSPVIDLDFSNAGVKRLRIEITKGDRDTATIFQSITSYVYVDDDLNPQSA